jgi:hypothetical protein
MTSIGLLAPRRGGRVVECAGLENQSPVTPDRGFESRPLRSKPSATWSGTVRPAARVDGPPPAGLGAKR